MKIVRWVAARVAPMLLLVALSATPAVGALADAADAAEVEDPAESRSAAFRAVTGPDTEHVPGGALLVSAYGIAWLLVLLFVLRLGKLQAITARDVERLERSMAAHDSTGPREEA